MLPVSKINYAGWTIDLLRLDTAHPNYSGNKYYKLKYNLAEAERLGHDTILTFGGAFSNHIQAVGVAGKQEGFKTIGIIRGEDDPENPTLHDARKNGMHLHFISRELYRNKSNQDFIAELKDTFGPCYILPEGGTNTFAVQGCSEILSGMENGYDHIFCPVGSGGTLAGIISTPGLTAKVTGIAVLKGDDLLTAAVDALKTSENKNWSIDFNYHLGGYAKYHQGLVDFIRRFYIDHNILLDPVYTGKMLWAVFDLISRHQIQQGARILAIHTGGTQGIAGWTYRFGKITG